MSIRDVIQRAGREPPYVPNYLPLSTTVVCEVFAPVDWDRQQVEQQLGFALPEELAELWTHCGGLAIGKDSRYCQFGAVVLLPLEVVAKTTEYSKWRPEHVAFGDLVFARFYGDLELALIRCDRGLPDCGQIVIVAQLDPRAEWYLPAPSLEEFLDRLLTNHGDKYWDVHYGEILEARKRAAGTY